MTLVSKLVLLFRISCDLWGCISCYWNCKHFV